MRPKQWIKNVLLFAALIFSQNLFKPRMVVLSIIAFIAFCLISSGVYLLNDLMDIDKDKKHPQKSHRPLAAGELDPFVAKIACLFLLVLALLVSFFVNQVFAGIAIGYLVIQIAYCSFLKEAVILDVFSIAAGFFLRVIAGAKAIEVPISSWLLICTLFLSLFLGLGKRRHELIFLGEEGKDHRGVLKDYNVHLLDQMVGVATAGTVISYALYTLSHETIEKFHTENLWFTIPIVLYGIFRYLYLAYQKEKGGNPELVLVEDTPLLLAIMLYVVAVGVIIYF
jgi:4-hydroxybenzoate polyprenyltransferase